MRSGFELSKGVKYTGQQRMGLILIVKAAEALVKQLNRLLTATCANQGSDAIPDCSGRGGACLAGGH
ncbi:hypothetical protein HJA_03481 [Hyphomonas jannaschiana VP2]|uniref:Uncharacterized protein n=1 Tax=Hyphomonas jannaschiana VP2 TaxID=1280952 RepID=A0A059FI19_9PROT|nr:hypothetical protein HJA_03481 [Hyphomonas jannaschiana VP2]